VAIGGGISVYPTFQRAGLGGRPVASFFVSPNPVSPESPVHFDASSSSSPNGPISSYHWDFGDRNTADTQVDNVSHPYYCTGTVTVTLTLTDATGKTASATGTVTITPVSGFSPCT
jgi:PKD repeat protein